jgi:hypothetical protein
MIGFEMSLNKLQTASPLNAQQMFDRMTEVERIHVRGANDGRLQWLAHNHHRIDCQGNLETMIELRTICKNNLSKGMNA